MPKAGTLHMDGYSTTDQGSAGVVKSRGSKKVSGRNPSEAVNWWFSVPRIEDIGHIQPIPLDEDGNPMHLCSSGHYESRKRFYKNKARKDGLDDYCIACRKVQNHVQYRTAAAKK